MAQKSTTQLLAEFCKWSPQHADMIVKYRPWGSTSFCIWLKNGMTFKVKYIGDGKFVMQSVSQVDIEKKYGSE